MIRRREDAGRREDPASPHVALRRALPALVPILVVAAWVTACADDPASPPEAAAAGALAYAVQSDRDALVALYHATDGPNWTDNTNWLSDASLDEWYGVEANSAGRVVALNLSGRWDDDAREWVPHGLTGPIPAELVGLSSLVSLDLSVNQLTGAISPELGNLSNLQVLNLRNNELAGAIPPELGSLSNLRVLNLVVNKLAGAIPPELGSLSNLRHLYLSSNQLTGAIPPELGNLSNLRDLNLHFNQLAGAVPPELGNLSNLWVLNLRNNELAGAIPPELGNLSNLWVLNLIVNELTGAIPPELGSLSNLVSLWLDDNGLLRGSMPVWLLDLENLAHFGYSGTRICVPDNAEIAAWLEGLQTHRGSGVQCVASDRAALEALYHATGGPNWADNANWLSDAPLGEWYGVETDSAGQVAGLNLAGRRDAATGEWVRHGLNGPVPAALANLSSVESLDLSVNQLAGAIPPELGSLSDLRDLSLSDNQLEGAIPPELGSLSDLRDLSLSDNQLEGSIPAEIGGLSSLESLWLEDNERLWGTLPLSLLGLENLAHFGYSGTRLCAPDDPEMARWLEGLQTHRGSGVDCVASDRAVLEALYHATDGPDWVDADNWLTEAPLAEWYGVETDSTGRVVALDLSGRLDDATGEWLPHGLSGPVPVELGILSSLESLDLSINQLTGAIPPELGGLAHLRALGLAGNQLTGVIPEELGILADLESLWLEDNERLLGSLPRWLLALHNLAHFGYSGTGLCVPDDAGIVAWLGGLETHRGSGVDCVANDRAALVALYNATDGPRWVDSENWLSDAPLGEWYGVETDATGRVAGLDLQGRWDEEAREWIPHGLTGPIPPELGGLSDLAYLNLRNNELAGAIPSELGSLSNLRVLNLISNELAGAIPPELGSLSNLRDLHLSSNQLTGAIPPELGNLADLRYLNLSSNQLAGAIPPELGNLSNLRYLYLRTNQLTGAIPPELGSLSNLRYLYLRTNQLTGAIPPELGSLSNLRYLHLSSNKLTGGIPPELGSLSNLESLSLGWNELTGPMPRSLLQLVNLTELEFRWNDGLCAPGTANFGTWLEEIEEAEGPFCNNADREALELLFETAGGSGWTRSDRWRDTQALAEWHGVTADTLGRVSALDLGGNGLAGKVPPWSRGALAQLTELRIGENADLAGRLPLSLADLSLRVLHYADTGVCAPADEAFARWLNSIASHEGTGLDCAPLSDREILEIVYAAAGGPDWTNSANWLTDRPLARWYGVEVDSRGRVTGLEITYNRLAGSIPPEIGRLTELQDLVLGGFSGGLTGTIPPQIGNLANLRSLYLFQTGLKGKIPGQLGELANLQRLILAGNDLTGSIPPELGNLGNLWDLQLDENKLTGAIPGELAGLAKLQRLYLAGNELTGSIPARLGDLVHLAELDLGRNRLTGSLPTEIASLANLRGLYLGHNDLAGTVPREFGRLTRLRVLALSGNTIMSGALPSSLTSLRSLETLAAGGTQLCAPSDPRFLEWLDQLPTQRVVRCGTVPAVAYLVQSVQSRDFPVPLVAGKEALLRVFVTAARDNDERLPPVRASFHVNGALAHVADLPGKPGPIPTDVDEGSLAGSANGVIPGEVVQPGLEMVIEVDPDETLDPSLGVARRIPETGRLAVDVRAMPILDLTVIPFLWTTSPDSAILDHTAGMAADPDGHELLAETRVLLPVGGLQVTAHDPVLTSSNNVFQLLSETAAIRALEGGGGHWKGMMSGPITGAGGVAYRPGRVSFSAPSVSIIAHELGHNMNLQHAPCGGAGGPDPAFPYRDGSIGAWGFDLDRGRLVRPSRPDLMSYCGGWVSDYHFSKGLRFRLADEGDDSPATVSEPAASLLLWGGVDSTGTPFLEPAFVVDAPSTLPASAAEYAVTGRDSGGGQLFYLSFAMPEQADGNGSSSFVLVVPVRPEWAGELTSISLAGPGGSVTLDAESEQPMAILRNPRTGQVRGILRDLPPQAQAAMDVAGRAAGPGLEVFFSRGIPGAEAWRR